MANVTGWTATTRATSPASQPGWYRFTGHGWEPVGAGQAQADIDAETDGWQHLLHVRTAAMAETPLF